ncbi:LacI family DNA-binding transcriptional regulator [Protaetiibacter intestinalis]|uniref:LacI family DNA-binding transcriptional regulator n=1 Tax=Protaetiibacter intestinalis TaxID=2419774 RepID=UPI0014751497|nr:LacI family DNA-binding transcriptional regulator [Protaetiibacter intestinalis]
MVTQQDVADRAGVGRRTVSHVVTDFPHVNPAVRERVLRAIDELGYVPNRAAQRLRTGRGGVIALVVPEIGVGYFGQLAHLVVEEAAARGVGTIVAQTHGLRERELVEIERILALQPDGLILSPLGLTAADLAALDVRTAVALIGERFAEPDARTIVVDNESASAELVAHLVASGRTCVAYVGGTQEEPRFDSLRRTGYLSALAEAGLQAPPIVELADYTTPEGHAAGLELVRRIRAGESVDAVFCVTDEVALGVLRALHDGGVRVPDEVAVAGFDDIAEARYATPRLTTVAPDTAQLARRAVAAALGDAPADAAGRIPHRLQLRESTDG